MKYNFEIDFKKYFKYSFDTKIKLLCENPTELVFLYT